MKLSELTRKKSTVIILISVLFVALISLSLLLFFKATAQETPTEPDPAPESGDAAWDFSDTPLGLDADDPENVEDGQSGATVAPEITEDDTRSYGIDVSKWQGKIDWSAVRGAGMDFAIVRIGYRGEDGQIYKDSAADYNLQQATDAGLAAGVYFYSTATSIEEAVQEAQFCLQSVAGYPISYPIVFDYEGFLSEDSRVSTLSAAQRTACASAFLRTVSAAGYDGMLYSPESALLNGQWLLEELGDETRIWVASYPQVTYPRRDKPDFSPCDAWQYTNRGQVNGVSGYVDLIVCYYTPKRAEALDPSRRPADAPAPLTEEELQYAPCEESVTAKQRVNLRAAPTTKSDVVGVLENGTVALRTGVGENGWSRLQYEGRTVYAITSYLTADLSFVVPTQDVVDGILFTPASDSVTAKIEVNLRARPTTDSEIVAVLKSGQFLPRLATSERGWSRLDYQGKHVYAVSSYLSDRVLEVPVEDGFSGETEQVTAKIEVNLRTAPSTTDSQIVHTLKNGEYITRLGTHPNGWSKLVYNDQTVYAITSYLTTQ